MPRSVNSVASRARRKKILKLAKGYFGARSKVYTVAKMLQKKDLYMRTEIVKIKNVLSVDYGSLVSMQLQGYMERLTLD